MKKALMISNSFMPANTLSSIRTGSFVRLLKNYGWEPVILTREAVSSRTSDDPEGQEMPEGMDVYRTNPWELDELPGILGKVGSRLGELFLAPDKERLWEEFSRRKAARIVKYEGIDLVYTASPPKSSHLMGAYLKRKFPHIPWIADICPELTVNPDKPVGRRGVFRSGAEMKTIRRIFEKADCVTTGSEGTLRALFESPHENEVENRCFVIHDGFTEELSGVFEKSCRSVAARRLAGNRI